MILAENYQYESLKEELLEQCNGLSMVLSMKNYVDFRKLSHDTKWRVYKMAITNSLQQKSELNWDSVIKSIDVLDEVYGELFKSTSKPLSLPPLEIPFESIEPSENPFVKKSDTDVVIKVGNTALHLHSSILSQCSPVFRVMLQGSGFIESESKEIFLVNRKASVVIEFFEFFYTWMRKEVDGKNIIRILFTLFQYTFT